MAGDRPLLKSTFKYEPLDRSRPAFRLLRLKSARFSPKTIECEIILACFDVEDVPDYEAISYTWGPTNPPRKIRLNGTDFFVRSNLWSLLRDIRLQDKDRVIWVDAICINQDNVRERGHQVQQIRRVYERAERVIFWLGQLTSHSADILMDLLAELQEQTRGVNWSLTDPRWQTRWQQLPRGSLDHLRTAFQEILERPWFRRVWILQEVANARAALVHCGCKSISAMIFTVCPRLLKVKPNPHCQAVLDVMPGPSRSGSWWFQDRRLHTLLSKFSETEASKDHDRIFALLGLCPEANERLSVDYEKSIPQLLRETISYILSPNSCTIDIGIFEDIEYSSIGEFIKDIDIIHTRVLEKLLQLGPIQVVDAFLHQFPGDLAVTTDLCAAAMTNEELGNKFLLSIFRLNPRTPQIANHQGTTPLTLAAEHENQVFMKLLIKKGADCRGEKGSFALYKALDLGNKAIVRLLLDRGVNCGSIVARFKESPLELAAKKGHEGVLRQLLDHQKLSNVDRALHTALQSGPETIARMLTEYKSTAFDSEFNKTLHKGNKATVQQLLDLGAPASKFSLREACSEGQEAIVRLLLKQGAPATAQALEGACVEGQKAIVRLLLNQGAPLTAQALEGACMEGQEAIVRLLLNQGAPATKQALKGVCSKGQEAIVRFLLDRDIPVTKKGLEWACSAGQEIIVRHILGRGIPITGNALCEASEKGDNAIVGLLLHHRALRRTRHLESLLRHLDVYSEVFHFARLLHNYGVKFQHDHGVRLLGYGVILEHRNFAGRNSLHLASQHGHEDVVQTLLSAGANCNSRDKDGRTPLGWALHGRHEGVAKLLRSQGAVDEGAPVPGGGWLED